MNKLLNRAIPSNESFNEFHHLMDECKSLLKRQVEDKVKLTELKDLMKELIQNQEHDGMWRLIYSNDIPYDAMVEYWKYPTILFTASMINFQLKYPKECSKLKSFEETLVRALDIVEKGKLAGHGFDSFGFRIEALKNLLQAGVIKFIELYPFKHKAFNDMIYFNKSEIEKSLKIGNTKFDYNEEFSPQLKEVLNMMNVKEEVYLFVYGTLMSSHRKGHTYLDGAEFKGECILNGFALYDLGYYPGIVEDIKERVKGELYSVPKDKLVEIDIYEAEGSLYKRKMVKVCCDGNEGIEVYAYIYNQSVTGKTKVEFKLQPWFHGITGLDKNYAWYACYGSNINKERFMKYINGCQDRTPPIEEKPMIIEHPIYFANSSRRWDGKGVAFLDINKKGESYGKIYLITREQFESIHEQEGKGPSWYDKAEILGSEAGIPIITITNSKKPKGEAMPSDVYIDVIKRGIQDTYPEMAELDIDAYLMKSVLQKENIEVITFLRNQEHGVSIEKIADELNMHVNRVNDRIANLKEKGLIKQDGRNVRRGTAWNAVDAVYYTVAEKRGLIDKVIAEI